MSQNEQQLSSVLLVLLASEIICCVECPPLVCSLCTTSSLLLRH